MLSPDVVGSENTRGRGARATGTSHDRRHLNPHLFAQTQLLRLKFRQRLFQLVRRTGDCRRSRPWFAQVADPAPSSVSPTSESAFSSFFVSSFNPDFCDFEKLFTKYLLPPCASSTASFSAVVCLEKSAVLICLRRQLQQFLRLFPGRLRALRQRLELGHLVGRGLNRERVIEILQARIGGFRQSQYREARRRDRRRRALRAGPSGRANKTTEQSPASLPPLGSRAHSFLMVNDIRDLNSILIL